VVWHSTGGVQSRRAFFRRPTPVTSMGAGICWRKVCSNTPIFTPSPPASSQRREGCDIWRLILLTEVIKMRAAAAYRHASFGQQCPSAHATL